jgi:hypothetical protein
MFGGVGPEDLLRGYVVLGATAILFGTLGLFISALFKRTQAATVLNLVLAVVFTIGSVGLYGGLYAIQASDAQARVNATGGSIDWSTFSAPPQALLWANPFAADADVACHADTSINGVCAVVLIITSRFDIAQGGGAVAQGQAFVMPEDSYWPTSVSAMVLLSVLMVVGSTQLISPTRRWRRPARKTPVPAPASAIDATSLGGGLAPAPIQSTPGAATGPEPAAGAAEAPEGAPPEPEHRT